MYTLLQKVSKLIAECSMIVARILIAFSALLLFLQVVMRYGFGTGLSWPEEATRYSMIWAVLLAGNVLIRHRELITVDFLDHLWPEKFKRYRDFAYRMLLLILLVVLIKEGILQAIAGWNTETTALEIRWFWPYLSIPLGVSLMFFQMICLILEDLLPAGSGK